MTERPQRNRLDEIVGGKYRIVRFLAAGGMGVVYEAQHTVVKRRFAVKFLHADLAARRDILTRFQREAGAAGALESENVTAAIDFGIVDDGTPYIVMEYLVGESLATLLAREQQLPPERAADLCLQACRGVQAAHAAGIVHRDLKPQNLFVCRREGGTDLLKVLDFGVAKLETLDDDSVATRTGAVLGTVSYMSPEQARGDKVVDHRADVYSLGAILYELLSGQRPHPGDSHNAVLYHISTQAAVPLESVRPGLPPGLLEIIIRALSSDPSQRPPSAEALGLALAPFARREVWPEAKLQPPPSAEVRVTSERPATAERPAASTSSAVARPAPAPPAIARPRVLITLGVTAAVAIAAFAFGLRTVRQPPATATRATAGEPETTVATKVATKVTTMAAAAGPESATIATAATTTPPRAPTPPPSASAPAADHAPQPPPPPVVRERARPAPTRPAVDLPAAPPAVPTAAPPAAPPAAPAPEPPRPAAVPRPAPVTFDQQNPYN